MRIFVPAIQGNTSAFTDSGSWNQAYPPNTSSADSPDNATVVCARMARNRSSSDV